MSDHTTDSSLPDGVPQIDPTQALREKLAFYEEQFPGFYFQQCTDWSFQHIDPRVHAGLGLDPEACLSQSENFFNRIHPKDRAPYRDSLLRFADGKDHCSQCFRIVNDAGEVLHHVLEVRQPLRHDNGQAHAYKGVWFDMSDQAELEAQVTYQEWQHSLGQVTRILLHDFRNAITGLQTLLELYAGQLAADHSWKEGFRLMLETTARTQTTVERLSQIVRDEPQDDLVFSLHQFIETEFPFWKSLWARPITIHGAEDLPKDFLLKGDTTTLRRFWLQYFLLHKPMEEGSDTLTFTWKQVKEGDWLVADALPFGLRADCNGLHLTLTPSPSPFVEENTATYHNREWPDARWRQIQAFADALKLHLAYAPDPDDEQQGTLHIFWPQAPSTTDAPVSPSGTASPLPIEPLASDSLDVIILGDWESEYVTASLRQAGFNPIPSSALPSHPVHSMIALHTPLSDAWIDWTQGDTAPHRLIFVHPIDQEPPANLPEAFFTLPSKLPENRTLLGHQLQELMR